MTRRPLSVFVTILLLACAATAAAQQGTAASQGDTVRKIIHEEGYRPTPGDVYSLTINYGVSTSRRMADQEAASQSTQRTETIPLVLQANYELTVPYIGEIDVRTLTYEELQQTVTQQLRERLLVPFVSLTLSAPAVYDVFIWGSVNNPGYHTISSINRLLDAIGAAGGTQQTGSRRKIEVHRDDEVERYDLLAFVAQGDEEENPFIRPGDRVFVPVAEAAAEVRGAVAKPGTYELLGDETVGEILELAGGLLPTAQVGKATVNRINESNRYVILDLADADVRTLPARPGDVVTIPASTSTAETVLLEGAIHRGPAEEGSPRSVPMEPILLEVPYTPGLTVLRVLEQFGGPTTFAEPERSFIIRAEDNRREPVPDLAALWEDRQWDRDITLSPGDRLVVPMKRLVVSVSGLVNSPGAFSFTSGYTVGDYLELAGGVDEENGSANQLFFAEPDGSLARVTVDTPVPIGANIYVGRSAWGQAQQTFDDIFTFTGWITGIIGVATVIVEFIQIFNPAFP